MNYLRTFVDENKYNNPFFIVWLVKIPAIAVVVICFFAVCCTTPIHCKLLKNHLVGIVQVL